MISRHASLYLCGAVAALLTLGLIMLASTGAWVHNMSKPYYFVSRQAMVASLGVVVAVVCAKVDEKWLRKLWPWMLAATCVLLVGCFVPGIGEKTFGSKRWIILPGLAFQPSEMAKVVCMIALASWFARWPTETETFWRGFVLPGMVVGLPIFLIAIETDAGTALAMGVTVALTMFCMGTRLRYLIPTGLMAAAGAGYYLMHNENRKSRIDAWLNLDDPYNQLHKGMQQWRALMAFGNGGVWGVGLGNGAEKHGTMALAHMDFIFPEIGEELGLPGTLGTVFLYVVIAVAGGMIAAQAKNAFDRALAFGLTAVIVLPAIQNVGVVTAMLPNDGLPLPFVSYGGTSLVITMSAVGLLCGVHLRSRVAQEKQNPLIGLKSYAVKL